MIKIETLLLPSLKNELGFTYKINDEFGDCVFFHNNYSLVKELFECMSGLKKPISGNVFYDNTSFWTINQSYRSLFIRQDISTMGFDDNISNRLSVKKALLNTIYFSGYKKSDTISLLNEQLEIFNLFFVKNKKINELDDISKLNFLFANALIKKPKYLLIFNIEKYLTNSDVEKHYFNLLKKAKLNKINIIIFTNTHKTIYFDNFKFIDINKHLDSQANKNEELMIITQPNVIKYNNRKFGFNSYCRTFNFFYRKFYKFILLIGVLLITSITLILVSNILFSLISTGDDKYVFYRNLYGVSLFFNIFFYLIFIIGMLFTLDKNLKNNYQYLIINGINKKVIYSLVPLMVFITIFLVFSIPLLFVYLLTSAQSIDINSINWDLTLWLIVFSFIIAMTLALLLPLRSIDIINKKQEFPIKIKKN